MTEPTTLAFPIVDEPDQQTARTATLFRLFDIAARRGYDIHVFAYEGAVRVVLSTGDGPTPSESYQRPIPRGLGAGLSLL